MTWVLDLDGVVWLAGTPIPGSPEAVNRLRAAGQQVVFVTNNAGPTLEQFVAILRAAGVSAEPKDLVTSAQAAASMLEPGSTAAAVGGPALPEALAARGRAGADWRPPRRGGRRARAPPRLRRAGRRLHRHEGARFVATNSDATYPTPTGLLPGAGAVMAYIQMASGCQPEVAGKPNPASAELVRARFGTVNTVVGDRLDTDGAFAHRVGAPFALVLTGVTQRADLVGQPAPALVAADLASAVDQLLGA